MVFTDYRRAAQNAFDWLTGHTNYTVESERGYNSIKKDTDSTFVFKTNGADVSVILLNDFRNDSTMQAEITGAFFAPFRNQTLTKILNFKTGIFIKKSINNLNFGTISCDFSLVSSITNYLA